MSYQNFAGYAGDVLATDAYALLAGDAVIGSDRRPDKGGVGFRRGAGPSSARQDAVFLGMADLSCDGSRCELRRPSRSAIEVGGRRTRRSARFLVPLGRAFATRCSCNDERGLGALFQRIGRVRRSAGRFAPKRRRRRLEGGRFALGADLTRRARPVPHRRMFRRPPYARATSMDMYDEPNPDLIDQGAPGVPPLAEAWRRCCARLRAEVGDDVFNSWFGRLALESVASGQARLSVPTRFLKSWIDTHYVGQLGAALNAEVGPVAQILIFVRCSAALAAPAKARRWSARAPAKTTAQSPDPSGPSLQAVAARQPNARVADGRRRFDRVSPRSAADFRDISGRAVKSDSHSPPRSASPIPTTAGRRPFARFTSIRQSASARPICCRRSRIPPVNRGARSSI